MKSKIYLFVLLLWTMQSVMATPPDKDPVNRTIDDMILAIRRVRARYQIRKQDVYVRLQQTREALVKTTDLEAKVNLLVQKDALQHQLESLAEEEQSNIQKIRYIKGLSIIKLLYEKVLSLDHHFSSLVTFNEINKISNPNNYPEFEKVKELIKQKTDKKKRLQLTQLLGQNMYTATIDMFIGLFNADANPEEKEAELKNIQCILDFTLRMNNDLKTIYFETSFLQKTNQKMIDDIERLFVVYTKPVGYHTSLKECRENDDWESIREKLNKYLEKMEELQQDNSKVITYQRMLINLNFPIDKLLQFINEYNSFIDQGVQYYQKFKIILNSYENERQCISSLPPAYTKLKSDIDVSIQKFNLAYRPVEINGSKMKELLYGINEYE